MLLYTIGVVSPAQGAVNETILTSPSVTLTAKSLEGNYDLHLYFGNTKPYLDGVQLMRGPEDGLSGTMHVPDDFDAQLEELSFDSTHIRFEVKVPANSARPQDMRFLYEATVSPHDEKNFSGHVTLTHVAGEKLEKASYVASFLMFKTNTQN
ncbi:MAG: hypothetical protein R3A80_04195 [Bdellovibrionota bacterium]